MQSISANKQDYSSNKLFVGNLPWSVTADKLKELFEQFGEITNVQLITNRNTGRSKGFGFVTFAKEEDAKKAVNEMNGKEIDDRKLTVSPARPREERSTQRNYP